ncbi:helix-turn-helix domain-containing protein [Asanoa sp. WMMD1127]|uniref:ArsR/SmtB family transcription factor n=1 Tax=Asanoa sp. WMMD1127 TaxID=3016107 RepID=UPI0024165F33|nr:helix-turn-helix domain-containing protein [Asanoa sp. WMMD1127]MDG4821948.1 helix-turn-helix domain-containing protein [Asanoa sp. WMMD1127]
MSLGDDPTVKLRALAHPLRLRILSLLTGAAMTAAEVARELDLTHANASYHLRHLLAAGQIEVAGEEKIRGGVAKRYRHPAEAGFDKPRAAIPEGAQRTADHLLIYEALAAELRRRSRAVMRAQGNHFTDAELWVDPAVWLRVEEQITEASRALHRAAVAPRTPGAIRVNATIALFRMEPDAK